MNLKPRDLPEAWRLPAEMLDNLEISSPDRRHYLALTPEERQMIDGIRIGIGSYQKRGMIRSDHTVESVVRSFGGDLDQKWLEHGKGCAVDLRGALKVLQKYAHYKEWAQSADNLLDIVIPYEIHADALPEKFLRLKYFTDGFVHLRVTGVGCLVGKYGEAEYAGFKIELAELSTDQATHGFRQRRSNEHEADKYMVGLVNVITNLMQGSALEGDQLVDGVDQQYHLLGLSMYSVYDLKRCDLERGITISGQFREILQKIARICSAHLPPCSRPIEFVYDGGTKITIK